jgi:hypothetical protein
MRAAVEMQSDSYYRRALHAHVVGLHDALDHLEADDALRELDWPLEGADALLRLAVQRFDQIRYCLATYGRTTQAALVPLTSSGVAG